MVDLIIGGVGVLGLVMYGVLILYLGATGWPHDPRPLPGAPHQTSLRPLVSRAQNRPRHRHEREAGAIRQPWQRHAAVLSAGRCVDAPQQVERPSPQARHVCCRANNKHFVNVMSDGIRVYE